MNYVRIKICGITNEKDAQMAVSMGADALGFIFCESPRQIDVKTAKSILENIPPFVNRVAVVRNFMEKEVYEIVNQLPIDTIQFHGNENEDFCLQFMPLTLIKAISIESEASLNQLKEYSKIKHFILDTYSKAGGGSGRTFNWELAILAKKFGNIILAGGLNPDNIKSAINKVIPYGVDVSSGVEKSPGIKDPIKLAQFIQRVKEGV
ncbi:MAG: phosphoribosylanthranilate isomerase [Spirochaetota bacterium]|nr:phosphoribosylanthranilate isomerase [Spirochaetota bacterium]